MKTWTEAETVGKHTSKKCCEVKETYPLEVGEKQKRKLQDILRLWSWVTGKKSDTVENREGGQFWLGHTDFEVPVGMKVDMLSKLLEMKSQNN